MDNFERLEKKIDLIFEKIEGENGIKSVLSNNTSELMVLQETVRRIEVKVNEVNSLCPQHSARIAKLEKFNDKVTGGSILLGIIMAILSALVAWLSFFRKDLK
ncbi:MAG: hypothetical protein V1709_08670 [Planctomycetota bacterium]